MRRAILYNDIDGSVIETLKSSDYKAIEALIHHTDMKSLEQTLNNEQADLEPVCKIL